MKNLLLSAGLIALTVLTGCKKFIEQQKENFVLSVMSDGQWKVTRFVEAEDTLTRLFNDYSFQFNRDYTVDAIRNGATESKGTWQGDPATMNITANFAAAGEVLAKINGVWHIYQNSLSYVMARQSDPGIKKDLRLDKK